jgi:hypothetical protein
MHDGWGMNWRNKDRVEVRVLSRRATHTTIANLEVDAVGWEAIRTGGMF